MMLSTAQKVSACFLEESPLTVAQLQKRTGIHSETIRRYLRPPVYQRVARHWATRRWEWQWQRITRFCECGEPATHEGFTQLLVSQNLQATTFLLCGECAALCDATIRIEVLYPDAFVSSVSIS